MALAVWNGDRLRARRFAPLAEEPLIAPVCVARDVVAFAHSPSGASFPETLRPASRRASSRADPARREARCGRARPSRRAARPGSRSRASRARMPLRAAAAAAHRRYREAGGRRLGASGPAFPPTRPARAAARADGRRWSPCRGRCRPRRRAPRGKGRGASASVRDPRLGVEAPDEEPPDRALIPPSSACACGIRSSVPSSAPARPLGAAAPAPAARRRGFPYARVLFRQLPFVVLLFLLARAARPRRRPDA